MKSKKETLRQIDQAILKEEMALPVYTTHISSAVFWSGLPEKFQKEISQKLQILHDDSLRHVAMLEEVKNIYLGKK